MYNPITETINPREAVLFSCGDVNEVARQFAEMLTYCISIILQTIICKYNLRFTQTKGGSLASFTFLKK